MSDQNQDTYPTNEAPASLAAAPGSEIIVMRIGKYPPKRAVETANLLLKCYEEGGIPHNAMKRFNELSTRRAFDIEDMFYAMQAGLEARRWEPKKPNSVNTRG